MGKKYTLADVDQNPEYITVDDVRLDKGGPGKELDDDYVAAIRHAGHLIETSDEKKSRLAAEKEAAENPPEEIQDGEGSGGPENLADLGPRYATAAPEEDPISTPEPDEVEGLQGEELDEAIKAAGIDASKGGSLQDGSMSADEKRSALQEAAQEQTSSETFGGDENATPDPNPIL